MRKNLLDFSVLICGSTVIGPIDPDSFSGFRKYVTFSTGMTGFSTVGLVSLTNMQTYLNQYSGYSGARNFNATIDSNTGVITFTILDSNLDFFGSVPPSGFTFILA